MEQGKPQHLEQELLAKIANLAGLINRQKNKVNRNEALRSWQKSRRRSYYPFNQLKFKNKTLKLANATQQNTKPQTTSIRTNYVKQGKFKLVNRRMGKKKQNGPILVKRSIKLIRDKKKREKTQQYCLFY